jgi:RNA polymerase sigma factor (sigma-70 family)
LAPVLSQRPYDDLIAIDRALERLGQIDRRQERTVELRYFGGLTEQETGEVLGVSVVTVQRDWAVAKAWLRGEIAGRRAAP